jgi:hypothetical protein
MRFTKLISFLFLAVVEARSTERESEWRNGPGKLWYDLANVPKNATNFDYGLKLSTKVYFQ